MLTRALTALALVVVTLASVPQWTRAADSLKVAISQRGFWDSSFLEFAQKEGFGTDHNYARFLASLPTKIPTAFATTDSVRQTGPEFNSLPKCGF